MQFFRGLTRKKQSSSSASAERRKNEQDYYLKNGSSVFEEILALCDGNCRIPIRYFSAIEIERAINHSESKMELSDVYMVMGSLDNRPVLVRFNRCQLNNMHRDMAITAQMSHLKNVLRLVGCCLEFEEPVMVYEYVEGISLSDLLFKKANSNRKSSLSWGNRLRIANEVASAIVFLHTEFTTPIIHRNIAPSKVIIDQNNGVAKILDFSLSISLPPGKLEMKSEDGVLGTLGMKLPIKYLLLCSIWDASNLIFLLQTKKMRHHALCGVSPPSTYLTHSIKVVIVKLWLRCTVDCHFSAHAKGPLY